MGHGTPPVDSCLLSVCLGLLSFTGVVSRTGWGAQLLVSDFRIDLNVVAGLLTIVGNPSDLRNKIDDVRKCAIEILTDEEFAAKYPGIDLTLV